MEAPLFEMMDYGDRSCSVTFAGKNNRIITLVLDESAIMFMQDFFDNMHEPTQAIKDAARFTN